MATFEGSSLAQCAESVPKSGDPQKVRMVMMAAVRVLAVMLRGEGRAGKDQQEQDGGKNLLHGENVPRVRR